ncbi:hypothetical protein D9M69_562050 [compost metagenome]
MSECLVIGSDRIPRNNFHFRFALIGYSNISCNSLDPFMNKDPLLTGERADSADHFDRLGDNIMPDAPVNGSYGHHGRRFYQLYIPGNYRLEAVNDLSSSNHRVNPVPGVRPVGLFSVHRDLQFIYGSHGGAGLV